MKLQDWSGPMGLVNCCSDEDDEQLHKYARMRKWVDKASISLSKAINNLEEVHYTKYMDDERQQLQDCIRESLRTINTATHLLTTLHSELSKDK